MLSTSSPQSQQPIIHTHPTSNSIDSSNHNQTTTATPVALLKTYTIGNFTVQHKLGQGAFGKVFLATHTLTNEPVAIKIIDKTAMKHPTQLQCVENEINIHKRLFHESIIRHYCVLETQSAICMITEYCQNGELFDYISKHKRLDEKQACQLFQQLVSGLYYLHQHNIAHRDIKLDNLLLTERNQLKIADFGLSKCYTDTLSTVCGSPCYAAPEIIDGKPYTGEAVDVWSSGIVLYAMLYGQLPFYDENKAVLFEKIKTGDYTIPSDISEPGKHLLKELLNVNPSKRISISEIYHHPWFNFLNCKIENIISPGIILKKDIIPIDNDLIEEIESQYKYKKADLVQSIILNRHNNITLVYYLCLKKKIRNNKSSICDISSTSIEFMNYIKSKTSKLINFSNSVNKAIEYYTKSVSKKLSIKSQRKQAELPISMCLNNRKYEITNSNIINSNQIRKKQLNVASPRLTINNFEANLKLTSTNIKPTQGKYSSTLNGHKRFEKNNHQISNSWINRVNKPQSVAKLTSILNTSTLVLNSTISNNETIEISSCVINDSINNLWKNQRILKNNTRSIISNKIR